MNVGLDDERVRTHRLDRVGHEHMPLRHDQPIDLVNRLWPQQADVVANPLPGEIGLVKIADLHDRSQRPMVLRQVLPLVVIQMASQPHRRQHQDAPVTQAFTATIRSRLGRDLPRDQLQNLIANRSRRVDLLSASQNRDQLIPAIEIQHHLRHTAAV